MLQKDDYIYIIMALDSIRNSKNLTLRNVSHESGINYVCTCRYFNAKYEGDMGIKHFLQICNVLRTSPSKVFDLALRLKSGDNV